MSEQTKEGGGTSPPVPPYDTEKRYDVRLIKIVKIYGVDLHPEFPHEMDGGTLNLILSDNGADCVLSAHPS